MVKASTSGAEDPGFESCLQRDFSGSSHTSDFKIGTPLATLPGTWHYRVSAVTGQPIVSILWVGEVESFICNFYLTVAARAMSVLIHPWDTLACCWDVKQPTDRQLVCCLLRWSYLEQCCFCSSSSPSSFVFFCWVCLFVFCLFVWFLWGGGGGGSCFCFVFLFFALLGMVLFFFFGFFFLNLILCL